jgi:FkbM family methyltransferase
MNFNQLIKIVYKYYLVFGVSGVVFLLKTKFIKSEIFNFRSLKYKNSIFLRNNTSDFLAFNQVFIDEEYLIPFNFDPEIIIDLGANVGYAAIYFKRYFPNAKVVCIEPDNSNFVLLESNLKNYNNVYFLKGAVWNSETAKLHLKDYGIGKWAFMVEETSMESDNLVKAYTLETIMKQFCLNRIDILKIDIEGSEKELFESNFEYWLLKTKVIIIELHDRMRKGCSKSFFKALSKLNYRLELKGENIIIYLN